MLDLHVVQMCDLEYQADGPTRGHAHIGLADHPSTAPGHADFAPLLLFGDGLMYPGEAHVMHRHENIENLLMIVSGHTTNQTSHGDAYPMGPSDLSIMSAGAGAEHAVAVAGDEPVRALVIWLEPTERDLPASFEWTSAPRELRRNHLRVLASGRVGDPTGALPIRRDAALLAADLDTGATVSHTVTPGRRVYLLAIDGAISVNGRIAEAGDRVLAEGDGALEIAARERTELVLLDMA